MAAPHQTSEARGGTLVFLVGPPAVGKMTVGRELSRLTGFPLFHNHLSIEAVLPVFGYGDPAFGRLVTMIRREVFVEAARSSLPGLIFTFVWDFDEAEDLDYVRSLAGIFEEEGGRVVYAELQADLATRLLRNETAARVAAKESKRDLGASRARLLEADRKWRMSSEGRFPLSPHLLVDNTDLSPETAARAIADHFHLPRPE